MYRKRNEKAKGEAPRQNLKKGKAEKAQPSLKLSLEGGYKKIPNRQPPEVVSSKIYDKKVLYRFGGSPAVGSSTFSIKDGHNQFLISLGNVVGSSMISYVDCWRIKKIRFYVKSDESDRTTRLIFTPVAIDADNFMTDINSAHTMTGDSANLPNCFEYEPSKYHPCGSWHRTSTTNQDGLLFLLDHSSRVDPNTFVEIEFQYVMNTSGIPNGYVAVATSIPSQYTLYNALWGTAALWTAQGVNTTTV